MSEIKKEDENVSKQFKGVKDALRQIGTIFKEASGYNITAVFLSDWIESFEENKSIDYIVIKEDKKNNSNKSVLYTGKDINTVLGKIYRDFMLYEDGKISDGIMVQHADTLIFEIQTYDIDPETKEVQHPVTYQIIVSNWK
jgi:hypothetical protein